MDIKNLTKEDSPLRTALNLLPISSSNKKSYTASLKHFEKWLNSKEIAINELNKTHLTDYFNDLDKSNYKLSTQNARKIALKAILSSIPELSSPEAQNALTGFFKDHKLIKPTESITPNKYLTETQVHQIIDYCSKKNSPIQKRRIGLIIEALFQTGCRINELLSIRKVDTEEHNTHTQVIITNPKGTRSRNVFISTDLHKKALELYPESIWLFPNKDGKQNNQNNIYKSLKRATKQILGESISSQTTPHTLRHSCAMNLLNNQELDIKKIQLYLGHKDAATTINMYIHNEPTADNVLPPYPRPKKD